MAKFCTQCGRPLTEGEVCECQKVGAWQTDSQKINEQKTKDQQANSSQEKSNADQKPVEDSITISTEDWVPIRKLIGIGESNGSDVQGCFERNKDIVPDLVAPCEEEVPVKQYHICNARSRIRGLWQEGRIQVTNKRVLFRLSGRSWIGKAMQHTEYTLDEIAGISISNGIRFGLWDFILGTLVSLLAVMLGAGIGNMPALLSYILAVALTAVFFVFKKKYYIKALSLAVAMGTVSVSAARIAWEHEFWAKIGMFMLVIMVILYIVSLFLSALKPSLSIAITTKCASSAPIYIWSRQSMVSIMEILPGEDAEIAIEELGTMIMDIQKYGDIGIRKWKEEKTY